MDQTASEEGESDPKWLYERGEGRRKHCWNKSVPGFVPGKRGPVGKCSNLITDVIAKTLLNSGFHLPPDEDEDEDEDHAGWYPDEIFNVHNGAVYVAVPTQPGRSYHGYPYQGRLPKVVVASLRARAAEDGCLEGLERWLKEHKCN